MNDLFGESGAARKRRFPAVRVILVLASISVGIFIVLFLPGAEYRLWYAAGLSVLVLTAPFLVFRTLFISFTGKDREERDAMGNEIDSLRMQLKKCEETLTNGARELDQAGNVQQFIGNISVDIREKTKILPVMTKQLQEVIEMTDEAAMNLSSSFLSINKQAKTQVEEASSVFGTIAQTGGRGEGNLLPHLQNVLNRLIGDFHSIIQFSEKNQSSVESVLKDMTTIQGIVSKIEGITENSKVLAINAAIEAARAGEQGKGFAVVATEFRKLSDSSAAAHQEIQSIIEHITQNARNIVKEMDMSMETEKNVARQTDDLLKGTLTKIDETLTTTRNKLEVLSRHAETLAKDISAIVVSIQFQDITRQRIEHVIEPLEEFRSDLVKLADDLTNSRLSEYESMKDHSQWLMEKYTMAREKEILQETYNNHKEEE